MSKGEILSSLSPSLWEDWSQAAVTQSLICGKSGIDEGEEEFCET